MEISETLRYEWCFFTGYPDAEVEYVFMHTAAGDLMVYCRTEKWRDSQGNGGFRTAPIPRREVTEIALNQGSDKEL